MGFAKMTYYIRDVLLYLKSLGLNASRKDAIDSHNQC